MVAQWTLGRPRRESGYAARLTLSLRDRHSGFASPRSGSPHLVLKHGQTLCEQAGGADDQIDVLIEDPIRRARRGPRDVEPAASARGKLHPK